MHFPVRQVRWWSIGLILALLFTQLATAAYTCPTDAARGQAELMATMPDCHRMAADSLDPAQPQLCQAHCQQGNQSPNPAPALDAPTVPLLWAVLDWAPAAALPHSPVLRNGVDVASGAPPRGAAPLYLRLQVLRN